MGAFQSFVIVVLGVVTVFQMHTTARLKSKLVETEARAASIADDYHSANTSLEQVTEQLWIVKKEADIIAQALLDYQKTNPSTGNP